MSEFVLEVNSRQRTGQSSQLTELRNKKRVPAIVYGFGRDSLSVDADYNTLFNVLKEAGLSNVVTLKLDGKEIKTIVKNYQKDPISDNIIHVDFLALDDKRKVATEVPLEFVGVSSAVREHGGKLNIKNEKVRVRCLPNDLPAKITVDLNQVTELGQKIRISDLTTNSGVLILNNPNDPVLDVNLPKKIIVQETAVAEVAPTEGAEVKSEEGEATEAKEGEKGAEDNKGK